MTGLCMAPESRLLRQLRLRKGRMTGIRMIPETQLRSHSYSLNRGSL